MSRNSKSARNVARRKANTQARQGGGGPAKTTPKHGKLKAWWQTFGSYGAFIRGKKSKSAEEAA